MSELTADVVIVGGGPGGSWRGPRAGARGEAGAALRRGRPSQLRGRAHAWLRHAHGIPPVEFRRIAREQLRPYAVTSKEVGVTGIEQRRAGGFAVMLEGGLSVSCRRVLLTLGMIDELPDVPGLRELWGTSAFSCPYCHGWEARGRRWGILATSAELFEFALFLTGWTSDVVAFTDGPVDLPADLRARLARAGVSIDPRRVRRMIAGPDRRLTAVETEDREHVPCEAMVVRPRQPRRIRSPAGSHARCRRGFVRTDENGQTSMQGIYAAGDLTTPMQAAIFAAAAGTRAAYRLNHAMNLEARPNRDGDDLQSQGEAR
ncbi:MAG: NAD(P)/FAD-dependent oxidoreductase [Polyangiaceae bacterium]|nr:NAD(P)/FAD-dependent oxidoreductase [Polyangiaceae bacterium]